MITIKNNKGEICDYRSYIDVDIKKEIENIKKVIELCHQKLYEITMIPKDKLR